MTENEIGTIVVGAAIAIHRELGPGLLESVYEVVLARVLEDKGLKVERQVSVPIEYRGIRFDAPTLSPAPAHQFTWMRRGRSKA